MNKHYDIHIFPIEKEIEDNICTDIIKLAMSSDDMKVPILNKDILDNLLFNSTASILEKYSNRLTNADFECTTFMNPSFKIEDNGYVLTKISDESQFVSSWQSSHGRDKSLKKFNAYNIFWFPDENTGQTIEFISGLTITPNKGYALIFPCTWIYPFKVNPATTRKTFLMVSTMLSIFEGHL